MSVIPAQVAGVKSIVVCTPPNPHPTILAAARLCGIEQVYQLGGAQAIAALPLAQSGPQGGQDRRRRQPVCHPGQAAGVRRSSGWTAWQGPTETVVVADHSARPEWVAADLLAQAEHDVLASAILLTPIEALAEAVQAAVANQMESLSRAEIIARAGAPQRDRHHCRISKPPAAWQTNTPPSTPAWRSPTRMPWRR
jgi:histidinol dehydrogenase